MWLTAWVGFIVFSLIVKFGFWEMKGTEIMNTKCPQKYLHTLNAYNSHVNNDQILYFTGIGVECS
jgi:hypothetical protein